jgi:hypothetical protein
LEWGNGRAARVSFDAGDKFSQSEMIFLGQPTGDAAGTSGISPGGARIESDGIWDAGFLNSRILIGRIKFQFQVRRSNFSGTPSIEILSVNVTFNVFS